MKRLNKWLDDVNWEIAMFLKHGAQKDGIFANLIVPACICHGDINSRMVSFNAVVNQCQALSAFNAVMKETIIGQTIKRM